MNCNINGFITVFTFWKTKKYDTEEIECDEKNLFCFYARYCAGIGANRLLWRKLE